MAGVKQEENFEIRRAKAFMDKCSQIEHLRQQKRQFGSITDKDLTLEVAAQDWANLYEKHFEAYCNAFREARNLEETKLKKQEMYIQREQEYRQTIEDLKAEIDRKSQKPLEEVKEVTEDEQQLKLIKEKQENGDQENIAQPKVEDQIGGTENATDDKKPIWELKPEQKQVKELHKLLREIHAQIGVYKDNAQTKLAQQSYQLWKKLDTELNQLKQKLQSENQKTRENDTDPYEQERLLQR